MDIQITGLEQVQRRLKEISKGLAAKSFAKALDRAAGVIQAEVQTRAEALPEASQTPLSEHVIVKVEVDTNKGGGIALVGFDSSQDERTGVPQDLKALWVEYGHQMIGHKPAKRPLKGPLTPDGVVVPHPFMRPAVEAVADQAIQVFGETLIEGLSEDDTYSAGNTP